jgi:hypothetical protein
VEGWREGGGKGACLEAAGEEGSMEGRMAEESPVVPAPQAIGLSVEHDLEGGGEGGSGGEGGREGGGEGGRRTCRTR